MGVLLCAEPSGHIYRGIWNAEPVSIKVSCMLHAKSCLQSSACAACPAPLMSGLYRVFPALSAIHVARS